jgi:hypothetical protein
MAVGIWASCPLGQSPAWWMLVGASGVLGGLAMYGVSNGTLYLRDAVPIATPALSLAPLAAGTLLAIPQWLALRRRRPAWYWVPVTAIAMQSGQWLSVAIGFPLGLGLGMLRVSGDIVPWFIFAFVAPLAALSGLVTASVQWMVLGNSGPRLTGWWFSISAIGAVTFVWPPHVVGGVIYATSAGIILARALQAVDGAPVSSRRLAPATTINFIWLGISAICFSGTAALVLAALYLLAVITPPSDVTDLHPSQLDATLFSTTNGRGVSNPAWERDGDRIVVQVGEIGTDEQRLEELDIRTGSFSEVLWSEDASCPAPFRHGPHQLPDGRIGYTERCPSQAPQRSVMDRVLAYDPALSTHEPILWYPCCFPGDRPSWSPDMRRTILPVRAWNSSFPNQPAVVVLENQRNEYLSVPLPCAPDRPAFSPEGGVIVLRGPTEDRFGWVPCNTHVHGSSLYRFDPNSSGLGLMLRPGGRGAEVGGFTWSPDGGWIASLVYPNRPEVLTLLGIGGTFGMPPGPTSPAELWFTHVATGHSWRTTVERGLFDPAWSPNGKALAFAYRSPGSPGNARESTSGTNAQVVTGIVLIDVPDLEQLLGS